MCSKAFKQKGFSEELARFSLAGATLSGGKLVGAAAGRWRRQEGGFCLNSESEEVRRRLYWPER